KRSEPSEGRWTGERRDQKKKWQSKPEPSPTQIHGGEKLLACQMNCGGRIYPSRLNGACGASSRMDKMKDLLCAFCALASDSKRDFNWKRKSGERKNRLLKRTR